MVSGTSSDQARTVALRNPALQKLVDRLSGLSSGASIPHKVEHGVTQTIIPVPANMISADRMPDNTNCTLFIGNVTNAGTKDSVLRDFLNAAMRQVGLATTQEDPICNVRMNNKFAFMDLRTSEDATNALNLTGIPFLGEHLKISRPSKYSGPFVQTKTWGEMIGQAPSVGSAVPDTSTKNYREVFVGNLPMDMVAPEPICEFFNLVMRKLGFASSLSIGKDPVVNVRMNKKFCFVEFFTVEEAIIAKNFDGIPFNGGSLSIKSPSNVKKNPDIQLFSWEGMLRRWVDGELKLAVSGETTNIICLENMLTGEELLSQDAVDQVLRDTREECMMVCAEQGEVLDIQFKAVSTLSSRGRIFIEMEALESAKKVMCALKGRDFDSRYVCSKFYPLGAYKEGNFGLNLPDVPICALSPSGAFVTSAHEFMSGA